MIVAFGIIIGIFIVFIVCRKTNLETYKLSSNLLIPFYKISVSIVEAILNRKKGRLQNSFLKPHVIDRLKQINPTDRTNDHIKKFYVEKLSLSFLIVFMGSVLTILASLTQNRESIILENKFVERGSYNEGQTSKDLTVSVSDEMKEQDINVTISEQLLTEQEIIGLFKQVKNELGNQIKQDNLSLEEVRNNLRLPSKIDGFPIRISWETSNYKVVGTNGEIDNEQIEEEGALVNLTATLRCQDYTDTYSVLVRVLPPILTESEKIKKNILQQIELADKNDLTSKYIELPESVGGKTIIWSEPMDNTKNLIWVLGVFIAILIYYAKDKDLETKIKKRNKQLLLDYPDIVSKLTLLLGAGMTVKGAWQKIALDYRDKKNLDSRYYRYAYEEMLISYYEIMSGVSEASAYEEFGKRIKNQRYMKLSSLITQNLKKGSRGLSKVLENESQEAFEERKNYAKTAGEEAGTKLMIPMFLNLIVVLLIIMIPACMSFQM